eukprot:SAG31_NODE_46_length_30980_cov_226.095107_3_plen_125_part_00
MVSKRRCARLHARPAAGGDPLLPACSTYEQLRDSALAIFTQDSSPDATTTDLQLVERLRRDDQVISCDVGRTLPGHARHAALNPVMVEILRTYAFYDPAVGYSQVRRPTWGLMCSCVLSPVAAV